MEKGFKIALTYDQRSQTNQNGKRQPLLTDRPRDVNVLGKVRPRKGGFYEWYLIVVNRVRTHQGITAEEGKPFPGIYYWSF